MGIRVHGHGITKENPGVAREVLEVVDQGEVVGLKIVFVYPSLGFGVIGP